MSEDRSDRRRGTVLRVIGTLLTLALFVYLLSQQGWEEILNSIRRISPARFLLVLALITGSRLAISSRWAALLLLSGIRLPLLQIFRITYAGLFASNFLPTSIGGDVLRLAWTARLAGERARYVSSIAVDRLIGLAGMAALLPLGLTQILGSAGSRTLDSLGYAPGVVAAIQPRGLWRRAERAWTSALGAMKAWRSTPNALLAALAFTFVHMGFWFAAMQVLFEAQGEAIAYWRIGGLWSLVYLISLFPVSINSLGLREVSTGLVYSSFGGVSASAALTAALLIRTATWLASLPGALSLPDILAARRDQLSEQPSAG